MEVINIEDISKKDSPLSYRNEYFASVRFLDPHSRETLKKVHFIIERDPLGDRDIQIRFLDPLDYPVLDLVRNLRKLILEMDNKVQLP